MKQGDIIKLDFDPVKGHEQGGYRPAVVVSNDSFNKRTNMILICPITNTCNGFPLHVRLDGSTKTTGEIKCEQVKAVDPKARVYTFIEAVPENIMREVVDIIHGATEII